MKLKKNIQMRDYIQVNGYADEKPIQLENNVCDKSPKRGMESPSRRIMSWD